MPRFTIVDEEDNIIGYKDRKDIKQGDIYRVSALWITNSKGDILLAQRSFSKTNDPGKWGPAVAGTVEEGEDYLTNIIKEAEEEIDLKNINPKIAAPKERIFGEHNFFGQWYSVEVNQPVDDFVIQKEEVECVKWFSKEEFLNASVNTPDIFLKETKERAGLFYK